MGSGLLIRRAVQKHGVENFKKEIIEVYETESEMNLAERILVVLDKEVSYNQCPGGHGGWGFVNLEGRNIYSAHAERSRENLEKAKQKQRELRLGGIQEEWNKAASRAIKAKWTKEGHPWIGRKHDADTKSLIGKKNSIRQSGSKNSQFGTCWITDGNSNRKIKVTDLDEWLTQGWTKGRKIK